MQREDQGKTTPNREIPLRSHLPRIGDYGLIGDGYSAALIHRRGAIKWLCWPKFDSEACLASILGDKENGYWSLEAEDPSARISRRYLPQTLILETRIETESGVARVLDFMPSGTSTSHIVRIVIGKRGYVDFNMGICLRFGYGLRSPHWSERTGHLLAVDRGKSIYLRSGIPLQRKGDSWRTSFSVKAREEFSFILTWGKDRTDGPPHIDPRSAFKDTSKFWRDWAARCTYQGPWRNAVVRSLITLKALTYRPTGAIIAAPSSSIPEKPGTAHNWDYRYCWLRDASFTMRAFLETGYREEAIAWMQWLLTTLEREPGGLQPIYTVESGKDLFEWEAIWLAGFAASKPVRFGNAAFRQRQLDVYGEVVEALYRAYRHKIKITPRAWAVMERLVVALETRWKLPDSGIWEIRTAPRQLTHSKVMAWLAFDRMISIADGLGFDAPLDRWRHVRGQIHKQICLHGYDSRQNSFRRDFDSSEIDASLLLLPRIGFLPPKDSRILGTIEAVCQRLSRNNYITRHDSGDGAMSGPRGEGAFLACGFWYADALFLAGKKHEAQNALQFLMSAQNDLGLLSEEIDPDSLKLTGNFPQGLSHCALINSAILFSSEREPEPLSERRERHPSDEGASGEPTIRRERPRP